MVLDGSVGTATVTTQGPHRRLRHDAKGVGTSIWPPAGTSTWPPVGTFSWPRIPLATERQRPATRLTRCRGPKGAAELIVMNNYEFEAGVLWGLARNPPGEGFIVFSEHDVGCSGNTMIPLPAGWVA